MTKKDYIENLIDEIKGCITRDDDVIALSKLLEEMLKLDRKRTFAIWKELIGGKDFLIQHEKVNYSPLFDMFLGDLLDNKNFDEIIWYVSQMNYENKVLADTYIYDSSNKNSFINKAVYNLIVKKLSREEKTFLKIIKDRSYFFPPEFSLAEYIKNIINWHFEFNTVNVPFLTSLTEYPENRKEQAVLKAMIIKEILNED